MGLLSKTTVEVERDLKEGLDNQPHSTFGHDDFDFSVTNLRINPSTSKPDFDFTEGEYIFDPASTETVIGSRITKHEFKVGTGVAGSNIWYPHIHWAQSAVGDVVWGLQYKMWQANQQEPAWSSVITTVQKEFAYTSGTIHQISVFSTVDTGAIISAATHVKVRISRVGGDVADTYAVDARFLGFDFHVPIDQPLGSRQEFIK